MPPTLPLSNGARVGTPGYTCRKLVMFVMFCTLLVQVGLAQPDPAITLDMADRRLADMQDSEKYTVFWGHDRQRMQSASPNPSGLSLGFAGTFGNLLGDNSKCEFYWEDVKAIHCSQIDVASNAPKGFYQCTLLVSGLKRPLTFQSSADGIRHLVSAVEFKIRSTTGGKNAPIAGIP